MDSINLIEIDFEIINIILDYVVTGNVQINNSILPRLIAAADYLQCEPIVAKCIEEIILRDQLDADTFHILSMYMVTSPKLYYLISKNLKQVSTFYTFETLDYFTLTEILFHPLLCPRKDDLDDVIKNWIKYDYVHRKRLYDGLCIATNNIQRAKYFDYYVIVDEDTIERFTISDMLLQPFVTGKISSCGGNKRLVEDDRYLLAYNNTRVNFVVGGALIDKENLTTTSLPPPISTRTNFCVCLYDDKVFVFGGLHDGVRSFSAEYYDIQLKKRILCNGMAIAVFNATAIGLKGCVYVIGGYTCMRERFVQKYDFINKEWKIISNTNYSKENCLATTFRDALIVVDESGWCELYEESSDKWKIIYKIDSSNQQIQQLFADLAGVYVLTTNLNNNENSIHKIYE
uniref:BTB domain-containing protein n=1 Tax=Rhabditophanes sp. KR3021 TaxID=114890 RepID=A0AC35UG56_9BILA